MDLKDLQATQQIISLLERAKSQGDSALDALPGIYAVIDVEGRILKGNWNLAKILGMDHEDILGVSLQQLFLEKSWKGFKQKLLKMVDDGAGEIDFEQVIDGLSSSTYSYFWNLKPLSVGDQGQVSLFTIIGKDITDLKSMTAQNARMEMELSTAQMVQEVLFPPPQGVAGGIRIAGHFEPATECGGDWWYYNTIGEASFLWIGDATGHGVPAALVTSAARSAVSVLETFATLSPGQAMRLLNRSIYDSAKGQIMMTFFVASYHPDTGELLYCRAGHDPPYLIRKNSDPVTRKDIEPLMGENNPRLGEKKDYEFKETSLRLQPGDRVLFYTDGTYDVKDSNGKLWGEMKFVKSFLRACNAESNDPQAIVASIRSEMANYRMGQFLDDDVTFFLAAF